MLRLRTSDGLSINEMRQKLGDNFATRFMRHATSLLSEGLLISDADQYRIPHRYWFVSDGIVARLI
jgi:coproporphyrinogen III oxidase-like Fe-S oxidoreductase